MARLGRSRQGNLHAYRGFIGTGVGLLLGGGIELLFVHQSRAGQQTILTLMGFGWLWILAGVGLWLDLRRERARLATRAKQDVGGTALAQDRPATRPSARGTRQ